MGEEQKFEKAVSTLVSIGALVTAIALFLHHIGD